MLMHKDAIKNLIYAKKLTIEIDPLDYRLNTIPPDKLKDYPNEWFIRVIGNMISLNKSGFLALSRIGWEANKTMLQEEMQKAITEKLDNTSGGGWEIYEEYAEKTYQTIIKTTEKVIRQQIEKTQKLVTILKTIKP